MGKNDDDILQIDIDSLSSQGSSDFNFNDIIEAKPNTRFATTFLSNKYRKYGVRGESLQDKATGEIFTKRPEDGRVVSFFQNKKYLHDLMIELKVLLNGDTEFIYPTKENIDALYLSTDYDVMQIYDEEENDISKFNTEIPNDSIVNYHNLIFNLSTACNGFFIRPTTRDADKVIVDILTSKYDSIIGNYNGDDADLNKEKNKYISNTKWKYSNAKLNYTVIITNTSTNEVTKVDCFDYIHINEEYCVLFPDNVLKLYNTSNYYKLQVQINSIVYDKLQYVINNLEKLGLKDTYKKFVYPDKKILLNYINIESFVDNSDDVSLNDNEFIIASIGVPYLERYLNKISKLVNDTHMNVVSPNRPVESVFDNGTIWAEQLRTTYRGGKSELKASETDMKTLEMYLSNDTDEKEFPFVTLYVNTEDLGI